MKIKMKTKTEIVMYVWATIVFLLTIFIKKKLRLEKADTF